MRIKGLALVAAGQFAAARELFLRVLESDGYDFEKFTAMEHLGDLARTSGDPNEAQHWYRMIIERSPYLDGVNLVVEISLAEVLLSTGGSGNASQAQPSRLGGAATSELELSCVQVEPRNGHGDRPHGGCRGSAGICTGGP